MAMKAKTEKHQRRRGRNYQPKAASTAPPCGQFVNALIDASGNHRLLSQEPLSLFRFRLFAARGDARLEFVARDRLSVRGQDSPSSSVFGATTWASNSASVAGSLFRISVRRSVGSVFG